MSRRHARFFDEGGKVLVEDVGSANGTFVDGERITGMTPLTPKSQVLVGDYEMRLKASARPSASVRARRRSPRARSRRSWATTRAPPGPCPR